jgi:O-antigen/teichoic acid export membrane protein
MATGLGWVTASAYLNRAVGFFTTLILARLLAPEQFGLITVASMMVEVLKIFRDLGFAQALIYRQDEVEEASDTALLLILGLNAALMLLAVAAAPPIARFFADPSMTPVLIVMSANLVPIAVRSVPEALLRKSTRFDLLVIPEVAPALIAAVVGIGMALTGYGVWSLVARTLLASVLGAVLIWWFVDYRPRWRFNRRIAGELYGYGKFIVGAMLLNVALYNLDKLYIAKFADIASLGIYTMAWAVASIPVTEFGHLLCRVAFPVFCQVNKNLPELRKIFLGSFRYNALAVSPMGVGIIIFGKDLAHLFLGAKWDGIGPALTILAAAALTRAISALIHELFRAMGRVQANQRFTMTRLILLGALGIPALSRGGLSGLCQLVLYSNLVVLAAEMWLAARALECRLREVVGANVPPLIAATLTIGGTYLVFRQLSAGESLIAAIVAVMLAILAYLGTILMVDRNLVTEARALFNRKGTPAPG